MDPATVPVIVPPQAVDGRETVNSNRASEVEFSGSEAPRGNVAVVPEIELPGAERHRILVVQWIHVTAADRPREFVAHADRPTGIALTGLTSAAAIPSPRVRILV
jgi:hypothetical protein